MTDHKTGRTRKCYLVKYEKHIYNSIRIGSLEYYRKIEGNQSDPMEGRVEGIIYEAEKDTDISREEILALSNGALDIQARDGITFGKGGSYTDEIPRKCRNAYIFCCSIEYGVFPNPERMAYFQANEHYVVDNNDVFRQVVSEELFTRAKTKDGLSFSKEKHYIKSWEAPVRYLKRIKAKAELPLNILDFFIYQKDPKFEIEQEYRFTWIFFDKETHKPVEMHIDPIDIECNHDIGSAYVNDIQKKP
ncbi:MAG: hypothetical protein OEW99_05780 [Gammaproteobacteria bacterium]|nr:hypothetical protein [Gammaproteobacteria bacterium]